VTEQLAQTRFLARRGELSGLLGRLVELATLAGRADLAKTAGELLAHVAEPFLLVVVGEVKTGKSSLLNALLGAEVSAVAPDPCTDRIRIIARDHPGKLPSDNPLLARVTIDHPMLDGIALVDTPGVDSIIDRHQDITEHFIPRADLVLFAFSSLNPYSRVAWDFFDLVAETWRRKVVFVLTQADLATPDQIAVNTARLRELAADRHLAEPTVFVVSATLGTTDPETWGLAALRRHIRDMTARGGHRADKLDATRRSALRLLDVLGQSLARARRELAADLAEADRVRERLGLARQTADREVEVLRARVEAAYLRLSRDFETALAAELTLANMLGRSVTGLLRRRGAPTGPAARLEALSQQFARDLEREVEALARQGAEQVFDDISRHAKGLLDELRRRQAAVPDPGLDALAGQRDRVLAEVTARVEALLADGGPAAGLDARNVSGLDPRAAMGGALVVVGTIFAVAVKGAVLDVTGGVVAAAGALVAGSALFWQRPRVLAALRRGLAEGGQRLRLDLGERLGARLDRIFRELTDRFAPFFREVSARQTALDVLETRRDDLAAAFEAFETETDEDASSA
jgi:ethanolamine utilization protein EutP (predicted NTPase)